MVSKRREWVQESSLGKMNDSTEKEKWDEHRSLMLDHRAPSQLLSFLPPHSLETVCKRETRLQTEYHSFKIGKSTIKFKSNSRVLGPKDLVPRTLEPYKDPADKDPATYSEAAGWNECAYEEKHPRCVQTAASAHAGSKHSEKPD